MTFANFWGFQKELEKCTRSPSGYWVATHLKMSKKSKSLQGTSDYSQRRREVNKKPRKFLPWGRHCRIALGSSKSGVKICFEFRSPSTHRGRGGGRSAVRCPWRPGRLSVAAISAPFSTSVHLRWLLPITLKNQMIIFQALTLCKTQQQAWRFNFRPKAPN